MANVIRLKNSTSAAAVPANGSLAQGEAAVNIVDKKIWAGNASSNPVLLVGTIGGRDLTISTSAPSGGVDGDLWIVVP